MITKIISYEKKEMISLTYGESKSCKKQKFVLYAKRDLVLMITEKNITKSEIIVITLENTEVLLMISVI